MVRSRARDHVRRVDEASARTGVLVMQAWLEEESETGLRVRITSRLDVASREEVVVLASVPDRVCTVVRDWLESFTSDSRR
jgi:hypothetical protein